MIKTKTLPAIIKRYSMDEVINVIKSCYGVKTTICKALDCTIGLLNSYLSRYKPAEAALLEARSSIIDLAEDAVIRGLRSDDERIRVDCAKMTLQSLGKERGWSSATTLVKIDINKTDEEKKTSIQALFGVADSGSSDPIVLSAGQL